MTPGEKAYIQFNEALGMATTMPYERLRPKVKEAWEKTAEYLIKLGAEHGPEVNTDSK